jgi:hypothetical protein
MIHWSLSNVFLNFPLFTFFNYCFCCWVVVLMHCVKIECMGLFLFSYICWGLLCALRYDQFWWQLNELLRKMYILSQLDEIFCRVWLGAFNLRYDLGLGFLYGFFVLMTYLLLIGALKSATTTVSEFICVFRNFRVCLMKLNALTLVV